YNVVISQHEGVVFDGGSTACSNLRVLRNDVQSTFTPFGVNVGTSSLVIANNSCQIADNNSPIIGGSASTLGCTAYEKKPGPATADPSPTIAGAVGDIVPHSAPGSGDYGAWICVTPGAAGHATFKGTNSIA